MASYRGHLVFASALGAAYGAAAVLKLDYDWGRGFLGAGLTTVGGLLPDLDSQSGVPVRELFSLTAVVATLLAHHRLSHSHMSQEQILVVMGGIYLFVRFGLSVIFKRLTVHRGMFHSIPAMLIAGMALYVTFDRLDQRLRLYLAGAVMLGFFSHLLLDEIYSVDFNGLQLKFNKFAGSALKLYSPSWSATLICYAIFAVMLYFTSLEWPQS